jgi:hypothetical protein
MIRRHHQPGVQPAAPRADVRPGLTLANADQIASRFVFPRASFSAASGPVWQADTFGSAHPTQPSDLRFIARSIVGFTCADTGNHLASYGKVLEISIIPAAGFYANVGGLQQTYK